VGRLDLFAFPQEVVIDGFKSYAHRTVVPDFDPLFNAITGLNGSGKSTLFKVLLGNLPLTAGELYQNGEVALLDQHCSALPNLAERFSKIALKLFPLNKKLVKLLA
jgi:ATPase subunit of ABC transporter with duplicated ATPase domains